MVLAVVGGGQLDTGYTIDNSLLFNQADQPRLSRTPSSTSGDQTFTLSFWVKRNTVYDAKDVVLFEARPSAGTYFIVSFRRAGVSDNDRFYVEANTTTDLTFAPRFRDASAWYHIVLAIDTTQGTSTNRVKFYVNGSQVTDLGGVTSYPALNESFQWNKNTTQSVASSFDPSGLGSDYQLAEVHSISGQQLSPTDFGEFDEDSGIWKPIQYTGTYGTNGFYLDFENSGSLGTDQSGNGNNFTPTNLASIDQTTDTPTNNFCTLNINDVVDAAGSDYQLEYQITEGNLRLKGGGAGTGDEAARGTFPIQSGKWYFEAEVTNIAKVAWIGISKADDKIQRGSDLQTDTSSTSVIWDLKNGDVSKNGSTASTGYTTSNGDIVGLAFDLDNGNLYIYKNGTALNGGSAVVTGITSDTLYVPYASVENGSTIGELALNFGNPIITIASGNSDNNGYGNFEYAPKSGGYLAICSKNLANEISSTIDKSKDYFETTLHTGNNGSGRTFTGLNFKPDLIWGKVRDSSNYTPFIVDSSRGGSNFLTTSTTAAEDPGSHGKVSTFNSDGTTWIDGTNGTYPRLYYNDGSGSTLGGSTYVFWQWKVNGGTTSTNTNGSITTTVQANQDAGISILTYVGTQANATIGHGLSKAPEVMIAKVRNEGTYGWGGNFWPYKNTGQIQLNVDSAYYENAVYWQNTDPSNTVITMGAQVEANRSGKNMIAYCFHSVEGFSKMGVYTGNGNSFGPFVTTGFRPAFVMWKRLDGATDWRILDTARDPYNIAKGRLFPNNGSSENTSQDTIDFFSNGFRIVTTNSGANTSGGKYGYMAFAENPFVSSTGIPVTAR